MMQIKMEEADLRHIKEATENKEERMEIKDVRN